VGPIEAGDIQAIALAAVVLAVISAYVLLWTYRGAVRKWNGVSSSNLEQLFPEFPEHPDPDIDRPSAREALNAVRRRIQERRSSGLRVQLAAGLAYTAVSTAVMSFLYNTSAWGPIVALAFTSLWPVLIVLDVFLDGRARARIFGGYFALLIVLSFVLTPPAGPEQAPVPRGLSLLVVWAAYALLQLVLLVPVLGRGIRSVGSVMLCTYAVTFIAFRLALVNPGGSFVAFDQAFGGLLDWISPTAGVIAYSTILLTFCLLLGFASAWVVALAHRHRWASDQSVVLDASMLASTVPLVMFGFLPPASIGVLGALPFVGYLAAIVVLRRRQTSSTNDAPRLLLLRPFKPTDRSRHVRFFRALQSEWRWFGVVQLLSGPDVATETAEPWRLLRYLSDGLGSSFVATLADLERAIARFELTPDRDHRFRVNELFCLGSIWRPAVVRLMRDSDVILIDCSIGGRGLEEEIAFLARSPYLEKALCLVDKHAPPRALAGLARTLEIDMGARPSKAVDAALAEVESLYTRP
jgi:hypothetical protein